MEQSSEYLSIKTWAEEDRPREKLLLKGKDTLSDAELIAILLRTGVTGSSALDIAKKILSRVGNNLDELGKLSVSDIKKMEKGLGDTKAVTIVAALELGRRRLSSRVRERATIKNSRDIYEYVYPQVADLPHEVFHCLYLNRKHEVLAQKEISTGGVSGTVVDVRIVLKHAVELLASCIVAVHNHPSGNLQPSGADINLTRQLKTAAKYLDIDLIDHVIIGHQDRYYSFSDNSML